jgi:hypothetical protein
MLYKQKLIIKKMLSSMSKSYHNRDLKKNNANKIDLNKSKIFKSKEKLTYPIQITIQLKMSP